MQEGKCKGQLEGEQGGKKQKTPNKQTLNNQVPQPLYQLRMAVQKHAPQTPISRVLELGEATSQNSYKPLAYLPKRAAVSCFGGPVAVPSAPWHMTMSSSPQRQLTKL